MRPETGAAGQGLYERSFCERSPSEGGDLVIFDNAGPRGKRALPHGISFADNSYLMEISAPPDTHFKLRLVRLNSRSPYSYITVAIFRCPDLRHNLAGGFAAGSMSWRLARTASISNDVTATVST